MRTRYSEKINGVTGNYNWKVSFDITNGFVGINQYDDDGTFRRVLLSKAQMKALLVFSGLTKRASDGLKSPAKKQSSTAGSKSPAKKRKVTSRA